MLEHPIFLFALTLIFLYGLFSKAAEKTVLTAPMVFVAAGFVLSFFLSDEVKGNVQAPWVKVVAELTLILVLFVDSSTLDLEALRKDRHLPIRLLLIGLPITMALGFLTAVGFYPDENIWLLALMALILSPTDAALGLAVVNSERVPLKIRQAINVESGLNDGFALPPILICLAVLSGDAGDKNWGLFTLQQFIFGPLVGGMVGWMGGKLLEESAKRKWMNETFQRLASLSIAVLAYAGAEVVHGNGFIAAFFSGMFLGTTRKLYRERIHGFGESFGQILVLFIFLLTGAILVPLSWPHWDWTALAYAVLSLTVIRMIPVAMSLLGAGLDRGTVAFLGWFGPRGIASILYLLMSVLAIGTEGYRKIYSVITLTVLLSIFLHGMSAVPFSKMFPENKADPNA